MERSEGRGVREIEGGRERSEGEEWRGGVEGEEWRERRGEGRRREERCEVCIGIHGVYTSVVCEECQHGVWNARYALLSHTTLPQPPCVRSGSQTLPFSSQSSSVCFIM